jgi:hypothetical protein
MTDSKISVALLMHDLTEVKELTSVFKKLGIIPHFYEDLKTFFSGTSERLPSLCIVDVKMMSEGNLVLADHPAVAREELPLLFYYSDKTEPLLVSTYSLFNLGTLKKSSNYEGPLKAILKRLNKTIALENNNSMLKAVNKSQREQIEQLEIDKIEIVQTDRYQSMVKQVCLQFEELRGETDSLKAMEKVFQGIDEIEEFALMELSFNGQKLLSPLSHVPKFRTIPSLWLGQACTDGIEAFAQNMASQVAIDIMGGELVSLLIKGSKARPDKILFVKSSNETFFNNFDWNMLEAYLNGFYASFQNKLNLDRPIEKKFTSSFEAMSFLDQYLFGKGQTGPHTTDYRLINLDLSELINVVLKKTNNRFFWARFEKEFINKLEIQSRVDFRIFEYGAQNIAFLIKPQDLDFFFDELKDFSAKFSYWKYFEDSEGVLSQIIRPKVTMVPLSAYAYLSKMMNVEAAPATMTKSSAWSIVAPKTQLDM